MTIPEDPEELRALFLRRMRERDMIYNNPQEPHKGDTTPMEGRDTKEHRKTPTKRTRQQPKPYRLIYLKGEETRAIEERRLTVEEVKSLNVDRDDDIPKTQATTKAKAQGANSTSGQTGTVPARDSEVQTSPRQGSRADTSTGRTSEKGPDETPAEAGEVRETGRVHDEGRPSSRQETSSDMRTGQVQERGPDETPAGAGEVRDTDTSRDGSTKRTRRDSGRSRGSQRHRYEQGRVHEEDQTKPSGSRRYQRRDGSRRKDQTSPRQKPRPGTTRDGST